jgi:hypothetical protein
MVDVSSVPTNGDDVSMAFPHPAGRGGGNLNIPPLA